MKRLLIKTLNLRAALPGYSQVESSIWACQCPDNQYAIQINFSKFKTAEFAQTKSLLKANILAIAIVFE